MNYKETKEKLEKNNQKRLMKILQEVDENTKEQIIKQLEKIDLNKIEELYDDINAKQEVKTSELKPISSVNPDKLSKEEYERIDKIGRKVLENNQFAVVTMSGGEGTRLGYNGPKGTYKIDVWPKPKYLFEIVVDTLKRANKEYNTIIPWYIMTSQRNNDIIEKFMQEHEFFGYPKEKVKFFKQTELPLITDDGNLILDENYRIRKASDGNGSIFKAMKNNGILQDMKEKGIKWVYTGQIDNILLKMADTLLLGVAIEEGSEIATRSIFKNSPNERTGSFCLEDGKVKVIEYSEFPEGMMEKLNENGELLFGESNVTCNIFSLKALEKISNKNLPYHKAHKKYAYMDENLKMVEPDSPNAYKFEYFIFDSFNFFNQISIVRGKREEDFAPIKNKEGVDSPETAKKLYNDYWKKMRINFNIDEF